MLKRVLLGTIAVLSNVVAKLCGSAHVHYLYAMLANAGSFVQVPRMCMVLGTRAPVIL